MAEHPPTPEVKTLQQQAIFQILLESLVPEECEQIWALYQQKIPPDQPLSMVDFANSIHEELPHIQLDKTVRLALLRASRVSIQPVVTMSVEPAAPDKRDIMSPQRQDQPDTEPFWKRYTTLNV